ncbi:MAG: glycosyltransferase family 4 protein [bacterium]|nr:glycosyltransferase family 4 protein [bacterium]
MTRILFVHNVQTPFISIDETILRQRYAVKSVYLTHRSPKLLMDAWRDTQGIDLIVAWFASWHSLPAFIAGRLRGIPRLLITGGYDVANMPEIDYGLRQKGLPKAISGGVFRLANRVLPFSDYAYQETIQNTPVLPKIIRRVYLGVPDMPIFREKIKKDDIVFTVSTIDRVSMTRKGLLKFVQTAGLLPDVSFVMVGKARDDAIDELKRMATPNVQFTGFLSDEALNQLRAQAKVYVQASEHEGFGLAVAEAMLARCVVVATSVGSLPEVIGAYGIFCADDAPQTLALAIQSALQADDMLGEQARQHILSQFPLQNREQALYEEVERLLR